MQHYEDKARMLYEQSMEVIHGKVNEAKRYVDELDGIVDEIVNEEDKDKADTLIDKLVRVLEDI